MINVIKTFVFIRYREQSLTTFKDSDILKNKNQVYFIKLEAPRLLNFLPELQRQYRDNISYKSLKKLGRS